MATVISSKEATKLAKEMQGTLNAIPGACAEAFEEAGKRAGKEAVQKLKKTAPKARKGRAKQWKLTKEKNGSYVIHSKEPWLPHLLENPHRIVSHGKQAGNSRGYHFIAPVEKETVEKFEEYFEKEITKRMGNI